uniref:Protein ANTAGONIST OF LIKE HETEROCHROMATIN PROTEIN 1-like n=1 Tax=Diabrotica virgifera virgifera TaxID=50390 RepID=A0A6P7FIS9_DIAVI
MKGLEWDAEQFFKYTRMTKTKFYYLLRIPRPYLQRNRKKGYLTPEHRLVLVLHYLAEGCSMQEIAWNYRIGKTTSHKAIKDTCEILWNVLSPSQLPVPTVEEWKSRAEEYYKQWNLPNCIGAVDGKHIAIKAPAKSGSTYFNYKKTFSIVLMATCDANYRFTMVDIGGFGSNHDSAIFKASSLGSALLNGNLNLPPPKTLPKTDLLINHYIVADSAFPLHQNIIRPYAGNNLGEKKNIFNYRVSRGRRTIENAFGILSQRWQILRRTIQAELEVSELIVQATVVLHNFLQCSEKDIPDSEKRYCPTGFGDYVDGNGLLHLGTWREDPYSLRTVNKVGSNNATHCAKLQRERLADYFISREGWLPWQENYVNRGAIPHHL